MFCCFNHTCFMVAPIFLGGTHQREIYSWHLWEQTAASPSHSVPVVRSHRPWETDKTNGSGQIKMGDHLGPEHGNAKSLHINECLVGKFPVHTYFQYIIIMYINVDLPIAMFHCRMLAISIQCPIGKNKGAGQAYGIPLQRGGWNPTSRKRTSMGINMV